VHAVAGGGRWWLHFEVFLKMHSVGKKVWKHLMNCQPACISFTTFFETEDIVVFTFTFSYLPFVIFANFALR